MTASSQLVKRLTDKEMNEAKLKNWLSEQVRDLGYRLAVREIYGENSKSYFDLKREHGKILHRLNKLERKF
tara:strand:- start:39 stop:251 length:213 start_codon:yes stop_codon:yes gene_type:complete